MVHGEYWPRIREHFEVLKEQEYPIDMVVVNLYPFQQTIAKEVFPWKKLLKILILVAQLWCAKNFHRVAIVVKPQ